METIIPQQRRYFSDEEFRLRLNEACRGLPFLEMMKATEQDGADSPAPSSVSMKSDRSKDLPVAFKGTEQVGADSPAPSILSMKSDRSKDLPVAFKGPDQKTSKESSDSQSSLGSIFEFLEERVVAFVKKEMKKFLQILSSDHQENLEDQWEDRGVVDEEEKQRRNSSRLVLNLTLQFMRRMNLKELADSLEKGTQRLLTDFTENSSNSKRKSKRLTGVMSAVNMLLNTCIS